MQTISRELLPRTLEARANSAGRILGLLALLLTSVACDSSTEPGPVWHELAVGFEPSFEEHERYWPNESGTLCRVVNDASGEGVWLEQSLKTDSWMRTDDGLWRLPRPQSFVKRTGLTARLELVGSAGQIKRVWGKSVAGDAEDVVFWVTPRDELVVQDSQLETAPTHLVLREFVERAKNVDGRRRVSVGPFTASGLDLWPGEEVDFDLLVAPNSVLRFSTVMAGSTPGLSGTFVIQSGAEELFRFEQAVGENQEGDSTVEWHTVALPISDSGALSLNFSVEGDVEITAFLEPIIGPREVGTYSQRPWGASRPNIVLFSADTMRDDSLSVYGGTESETPNLDRLTDQSVVFLNSYAPSSWTLPSHATMLTGLFPRQHGAIGESNPLSTDAVTMAEQFARHGYRTGAVTDSIFVSRSYGLDQGFAWFEEHEKWYAGELLATPPLARTFQNSIDFLNRDDGRPVLLFVHTYRAHTPYRPTADEDPAENERIRREGADTLDFKDPSIMGTPALAKFAADYRELYFKGVTQLDVDFGPYWKNLTDLGVLDSGLFCLTSDHGEAFFEHGQTGHRFLPHEEQIRVPLFIYSPNLAPRKVELAAGILDIPKTLASFAGIPVAEEWVGKDLLGDRADGPVYSNLSTKWAVIDGSKKVLFKLAPNPKVLEAYDLDADPLEKRNLVGKAQWPKQLVMSHMDEIKLLNTRQLFAEKLNLSTEMREQLEELGYTGDDE